MKNYHDFVIKSTYEQVPPLKATLRELLDHFGFEDPDHFEILLSFEEAVSNAIKHGNRFSPDKSVLISIVVDHDHITITIRDEGAGFDPTTVPDPTSPEALDKPSGRGILLIHHYMCDVNYSECGRKVTMKKMRNHRS